MYVGFSYVFFALGFLWLLAEVKRNVGARNSGFPIFAIQLNFRAMAKFRRCFFAVRSLICIERFGYRRALSV
jgi:hypothetical protein